VAERLTVMISSTARDLPEHRQGVLDACLRQGMFPVMMESLPALDADAIKASLDMVDKAEIYLGIFAYRYGYVPKGYDISITEMEYNRALERGIPRLIFIMHADHPLKAADFDKGEGAAKVEALKKRAGAERVVGFFKSPDDLRALVINSLSKHHKADVTAFQYVSEIPAPSEPYVAHPYVLLQTHRLVGRQDELNLLTDWVAKPAAEVYRARILNVVAIGGMGKSALTWKWFNDIAPQEMKPLAGRMWWSFYESDATFENFVTRALAYVTRRPREEVERIPPPDREAQLLSALDREPFLVALDGLERILIAYARMDCAHMSDEVGEGNVPRLRKSADPRAGRFLRKLAGLRKSRIIVSSRLYPADIENVTGDPAPGCSRLMLDSLCENDAVELWRSLGVSGSRAALLQLFESFDRHPLLIQALAGEIRRYRRAPGDYEKWRRDNRRFDPQGLPSVQDVTAHVLEFALRGLDESARKVLYTVAAFRMPAAYDTLLELLVCKSQLGDKGKQLRSENALDAVLTELEDRGLLGWDKCANRYDLHPIVRGATWQGLEDKVKRGVCQVLQDYFGRLSDFDPDLVNSLSQLTPAIELYNTLVGLRRHDEAYRLFFDQLEGPMMYRLNACRQAAGLLEMLFPGGSDRSPCLSEETSRAYAINSLAHAYTLSGQPARAIELYRRSGERSFVLSNMCDSMWLCGRLYESRIVVRRALKISLKAENPFWTASHRRFLGLTLAALGRVGQAEAVLRNSVQILASLHMAQGEAQATANLSRLALWAGNPTEARRLASRTWDLAESDRYERDFICATRLLGMAALDLGLLATADQRLHDALTRARAVNLTEEELPVLIALAELRRRQGDLNPARELLDDVWEPAERGPFPLLHADALNVLAQIERDAGNREAAVAAATKAYRLAWCDGPPYAYHWGLEAAQKHLAALGEPEPTDLAPFDESKFEPMPQIEIDPQE
jgi:tetratricopeptide (TPR) repeat protein